MPEHEFDHVDLSLLPPHMHGAVRRYLNEGIELDDFLTAALSNQLVESFRYADTDNLAAMPRWAEWLLWECPSAAYGSPEKVGAWCESRQQAVKAAREAV